MTEKKQWLLEVIGYFRRLDFFREYAEASDEAVLTALDEERRQLLAAQGESEVESFEDLLDLNDDEGAPELLLVSYDQERVWNEDIEQEFYPGDDGFKRILTEWSRISRGAFMPQNIEEFWPYTAAMFIEFDLNETRRVITPWETMPTAPRAGYGMIDLEMLNAINEMIADSGCFFAIYDLPYQDFFVVVLTAAEQEKLEAERGWKFAGVDEDGFQFDSFETHSQKLMAETEEI